ncbi:MAG TPA: sugar ABC transporter ATP-binding protein [Chloroflexia bacterium]|nr:sugar ABC transporter ATP-binding protein [Chloroflexia bacterium]
MTVAASSKESRQTDDVILRAEGITKIFGGTVALKNVNFNVYQGKVNVLIGENGAGKSTLMKILAGVEQPTSGRLLLEGKEVSFKSSREAARHGIGMIFQELNLFPNLSVTENIFTAREITSPVKMIDRKAQTQIARDLLARLAHPIDPNTLVSDLPLGLQQIVEIAKALARNARILIMDEPTSALSQAEVAILFDVIRDLKAQGVSIIYISHKLEELLRIGDYITVFRDGQLVAQAAAGEVDVPWIVNRMVGRDTKALYRNQERTVEEQQALLSVENLTLPKPGGKGLMLDSVSFALKPGEIVAIYGLMGAGRTELLESLIGVRHPTSGSIRLNGKEMRGSRISQRIQQGMVLIPEDRQREGLVQTLSVGSNMTLASLRNFTRNYILSRKKEQSGVKKTIADLSIKVFNPDQLITALSGGNQQKVVIGKGLLTSPKVLLMDEPTRGIDVGAKAEIFELMSNFAAQGLGVLFVSSDLMEVLAMGDRILVMSNGKITGEFKRGQASEEALVSASAAGYGIVKTGVESNG